MSCAIRDLHIAYPKEYLTDVRSPCNEIYEYNPYIMHIDDNDPEAVKIDMQYPLIHKSGYTGLHFSDGYRVFLEEKLGRPIPKVSMRPEIYLSQGETEWVSQVRTEYNYSGKYWIINAGIKNDYTLKWYPFYQEVVDMLLGKVKFVQVGVPQHKHPVLKNVINMIGKTNSLRHLFRLSYHAEGALCGISLQMVIMQAFRKPCVVVAGGREGMRWQAINCHKFLHTIGAMKCCLEDGCWKSKESECVNMEDGIAKCMRLIKPKDVADAIEMYYAGGRLEY
jgi:hypothetical protein